ncbi:MAG: metal ABC transporter permease [Eubacteriales bacterium]
MEVLQYEFMRNALTAGILASIACGIVGTFVVVKRIVFISGGISHSAYGGIGLGYYFGFNPMLGAVLFSLMTAMTIGLVSKKPGQREDTLIGVMWAIGMAIGVVFIQITPGYTADLFSYLFGSILAVPTTDITLMFILDILIMVVVFIFFREFTAICFDEEFAALISYPKKLYLLLLCLVALTVVTLIRVVGIILVIAMITIPAGISAQFTESIKKMMFMSVLLGTIFTTLGLVLSYKFDIASGAAIILVSGVCYIFSLGIKYVNTCRKNNNFHLGKG